MHGEGGEGGRDGGRRKEGKKRRKKLLCPDDMFFFSVKNMDLQIIWESEHLEKSMNTKIAIKYELHFYISAANTQKLPLFKQHL